MDGPESTPSHADPSPRLDPESVGFVLELGRALHSCGTPAHRLEEAMLRISDRLNLPSGQFFSTPTSITASFGPIGHQQTGLLRVEPGETNLDKLVRVDRVADDVASGATNARDGLARIREILAIPARFPWWVRAGSFGVSSSVACRFFGGGWREIVVAGIVGLSAGALAITTSRLPSMARLSEFFAGLAGGFLAAALSPAMQPFSPVLATLAGLIVFMPGLTITLAMTELATRNLVSGTARLMGALMTLVLVGMGVAVGRAIAERLVGQLHDSDPSALPDWTQLIALGVAPISYTVLFNSRSAHFLSALVAVFVGFFGARAGAIILGPELGVSVGAFLVGLTANLYARFRSRPAALVTVPGMMVLVPGGLGFKSLEALLGRDVLSGVEIAVSVVLIAASLVGGLFLANVAAPTKKLV